MFRRNLWKLTLSLAIVIWAASELIPLKDREFAPYVQEHATAKKTEFAALIKEVSDRVATGKAPSTFVALKKIAEEKKIDLAQFFPQIPLEDSMKNLQKRNNLILEELHKKSKGRLQLGLDLKGGVAFTLETTAPVDPNVHDQVRKDKLDKAVEIIGARVNGLGVAEPVIRVIGDNRIEVQLASVSTKENPEVASMLRKPARLDFALVMQGTSAMTEDPGQAPPGYRVMSYETEDRATGKSYQLYYTVKAKPEMTGEGITDAGVRMDNFGGFEIDVAFDSASAKRFGDLTTANVGRAMAIILDGRLYSAPGIREPIPGGRCQISGGFTQRQAFELANVLNNPLDLPLEIKEQYEVGPSLAKDSIESGKLAFIISASLTALFIVFFYTTGGFLAVCAMLLNVLIMLGVMASIGTTLTMPGIAGIVLTLAMSVDSNILIFERMREELRLGKSLPVALEAGFDKAFSAIVDGNLTTLLTAGIMAYLGTGPIKGFGVTLAIGIFTTMFAALVISRLFLDWAINGNFMKRMPMISVLQDTNYDFLKVAKPAFIGSWVIVLLGVGMLFYKGDSIYGIDFKGGDQVSLSFKQKIDLKDIRDVAEKAGVKDVNPTFRQPIGSDREMLIILAPYGKAKTIEAALQSTYPAAGFVEENFANIGPSIGDEIKKNAALTIGLSLLGILIYVAFRFEMGYAIGAVIATVHDLLMTIGIFVLFDRQFNAAMVAAILLIIGYSVNDTVVVFDRIREELKLNPTGSLRDIILRSLNLTLSRTIITGGTTLLTSITLMVVTSGEVNDIAFTLLIGVLTGTFSSLFIASPVFYWWHKGDRKHVEAHHDIAPKYDWAGSSKASE